MAEPTRTKEIAFIDCRTFFRISADMHPREIGVELKRLLRGKPSLLEPMVAKRKTISIRRGHPPGWSATRQRIFERDGCKCVYCGATENLSCDHIVAYARGGSHDDDNLTTACRSCNSSKSHRSLEEWGGRNGNRQA